MRKYGAHLRRALNKSALPTEPVTVPALITESDPVPHTTPSLSAYLAVLWSDSQIGRDIGLFVGAIFGAATLIISVFDIATPPPWLLGGMMLAIPGTIEVAYKAGKAIPPALQRYADSLTQRARIEERARRRDGITDFTVLRTHREFVHRRKHLQLSAEPLTEEPARTEQILEVVD